MAGTAPTIQNDKYLWGARWIQLLFTVVVLAVTGDGAALWHSIDCNIPSKLAFNIAAAALTLPIGIYLLVCTGPKAFARFAWQRWAIIGLDVLMLIIWIAATAASVYDCEGVCQACSPIGIELDAGYGFWISYGSLFCQCYFADDFFKMRARNDVRMLLEGRRTSSSSGTSRDTAALGEKSINIAAKRGLDIVMIFLFLVTLGRDLALLYSSRNTTSGAPDADAAENALRDYTPSNVNEAEQAKGVSSVNEESVRA